MTQTPKLSERRCVPCKPGTPPLDEATTRLLLGDVPGWGLRTDPGQPTRLGKRYEFTDFLGAMAFVGRMAKVAEAEAHHPDFCVHYNRVEVTLWTHTVGGLSENDFILAAKLDAAPAA
jgi:4a-hydroxytetrahydrobiopterin dehydratase